MLQVSASFDEAFDEVGSHTSSRSRPFEERDDLHAGDEDVACKQQRRQQPPPPGTGRLAPVGTYQAWQGRRPKQQPAPS